MELWKSLKEKKSSIISFQRKDDYIQISIAKNLSNGKQSMLSILKEKNIPKSAKNTSSKKVVKFFCFQFIPFRVISNFF